MSFVFVYLWHKGIFHIGGEYSLEQKELLFLLLTAPSYEDFLSEINGANIKYVNDKKQTSIYFTNGGAELKEVGFCWIQGTDDEPTTRLFLGKAFSGITTSAFKHTITTLEPQKVYSFRPYVINKAGGVSYGKVKQFTTSIALETPDAGDNGGNEPETGDDEPIDPWEGEDNDPIPFE